MGHKSTLFVPDRLLRALICKAVKDSHLLLQFLTVLPIRYALAHEANLAGGVALSTVLLHPLQLPESETRCSTWPPLFAKCITQHAGVIPKRWLKGPAFLLLHVINKIQIVEALYGCGPAITAIQLQHCEGI